MTPAPAEPDPTLEEWRELYAAAGEYGRLAPWDWMADTDVFGVQDPETGTIGWCCVFGGAGEVFGLMVYAGTEGLAVHHGMATEAIGVDDAGYLQAGWLASFEDRPDLDRADLAVIKRLGLRFRGRRAWPRFRTYTPGFLPWRLTGGDARFLATALRQAIPVALRLQEDADAVVPDEAEGFLVRVAGGSGGPWQDRRLVPPPIVREAPPPGDQLRVRRLRDRLHRQAAEWECDYYHSPAIIDDGRHRPYFASSFLVVDGRSGMVLQAEMGEPPLRPAVLQEQFLDAIEKLGVIPTEVRVKRGLVHDALAPLAGGLGLNLRRTPTLPALDPASASLAAHLRRH